jgi:hypothetical protein
MSNPHEPLPALVFENRIHHISEQLALFEWAILTWIDATEDRDPANKEPGDGDRITAAYGAVRSFARMRADLSGIVADFFPVINQQTTGGAR